MRRPPRGWFSFLAPAFALAGLLLPSAARAASFTSVTTAFGAGNSTNLLVDTAAQVRVRDSALGVVSSDANSFQTRYAMAVGTDLGQLVPPVAGITESFAASYTITLSILGSPGENWQLVLNTSRVGALTIVSDGNGSASAMLGDVTGAATGGSLTGSLGLPTVGTLSNAVLATSSPNTPFDQSSSAVLAGIGTGAVQTVIVSFSWTASTTSTRQGNNGDEAAVRMGQASTTVNPFAADDYPGAGARTQGLDGHHVSATLTPEPGTSLLLAMGLAGLAWSSRRRGRDQGARMRRLGPSGALLAVAALTSWAPAASALTLSAPSLTNGSTTAGSGGNAADRAAQHGTQILASDALGFGTRFWTTGAADRGFSLAGGTANQGTTMSYTISFTVVHDAGAPYTITVSTALLGALTALDDAGGLAGAGSASAGVVSGSVSGGSVATGGLGLSPASGPIGGTGSTSGAVTIVSRSNLATIDAIGTGLPQAYTLGFGASFSAGSPQGFFGGDETSYRFGFSAATGSVLGGASADDYAGPGARNGLADGHFVTVAVIPEPETALLLGAGLLGLAGFGRRSA